MADKLKQHVQHVGSRKAFEARHVRTNRVEAFGVLAYATGYGRLEELEMQRGEARIIRQCQGVKERDWVVERHVRADLWISADRGMQGATREEADNLIRGWPQYRVRRLYKGRN